MQCFCADWLSLFLGRGIWTLTMEAGFKLPVITKKASLDL